MVYTLHMFTVEWLPSSKSVHISNYVLFVRFAASVFSLGLMRRDMITMDTIAINYSDGQLLL